MINVELNLPREQRFEVRSFNGFTDWTCNCPPGFFNEIENIDIQDDGSLCVRNGSSVLCPDSPLTELGNTRIERIACFKNKLFIFQEKKLFCKDDNGIINAVTGPKGGELFFEADEDTCSDHDTWNEHLLAVDGACSNPVKIYCDQFGAVTAKAMGLPAINITPDLNSLNPGTSNYVYAFFYCCEYTVASGKFFQDVGPINFVRIENATDFTNGMPDGIEITNIPELECPDGTQFNLANTRIHIYRTTNNGTTFFEVAKIPTTTAAYQDGLRDNVIQNNQVIYNQGSTVQWTQAPASEFIEVIDDIAWYAGRTCVDGVEYNNRLYQSIPGAPWSAPREFYVEFEGRINGLSQYARFPIVSVVDDCGHCQLYRVQGRLDIFGRDQLVPYVIADSTAAINNNSFVKAETGLYFFGFGGSGIYRTDAYKVQKVTNPKCSFDETYCKMIDTEEQRKRVHGAYDKKHNRIYWAVSTVPGLQENNKMLVYHEHHNAFTWYSNGASFQPSAITYDNLSNTLIRADARGYVFEHRDTDLTDPRVDVSAVSAASWGTDHIPFCLKTTPIDFGDCVSNKQVNKVYFRGKPDTNQSFQIESFDNGCDRPTGLNCIEFKQSDGWCMEDTWCQDPAGWCVGTDCALHVSRRFPCTRTMTKEKSIRICAKETVLECGQVEGEFLRYSPVTDVIRKLNGGFFDLDDVGRKIQLGSGEIGNIIFVNSLNGRALLEFEDGVTVAAGDYPWALIGYPKNERFCLDCFGFFYCVLGDVGGEFHAGESKALSWESAING